MTFSYVNDQRESEDWSTHYRALLEYKLEEAGISPPGGGPPARGRLPSTLGGENGGGLKKVSKGYQPSVQRVPTHTHLTSAIAKSENERRKVEDMLAKTTKRALAAEERASEAVVVERKARAALDAREKQMASMRLRLDKMSENIEASEAHRKELQDYVGKLERKLGGRSIGLFRRGMVSPYAFTSYSPSKLGKESLYDALAELQNENAKLHSALQEVEEALDGEAKALSMADGGALLESLRTRRLLETAELALKKETAAKKQAETMQRQAEMRAIRAEDERTDRVKAEDALLARCEVAERDNQALLDYVQELTSQTAPSPAKRLSSQNEVNELKAAVVHSPPPPDELPPDELPQATVFKASTHAPPILVKNVREAREKAAELQWQLEQQHETEPEDNARVSCLENIIDDLVSMLSKTLGVEGVSKGYQHPSIDAMIFATQRLVTKMQTELQTELANPSELREAKESVRNLTTELRVYKMKVERLHDKLEDEIDKSSPPAAERPPSSATPKRQPSREREIDSKMVFASRIDRIAALKKRLGLAASSPQGRAYNGDDSEGEYN